MKFNAFDLMSVNVIEDLLTRPKGLRYISLIVFNMAFRRPVTNVLVVPMEPLQVYSRFVMVLSRNCLYQLCHTYAYYVMRILLTKRQPNKIYDSIRLEKRERI